MSATRGERAGKSEEGKARLDRARGRSEEYLKTHGPDEAEDGRAGDAMEVKERNDGHEAHVIEVNSTMRIEDEELE